MFKPFLASATTLGLLMSASAAHADPMLYTIKKNAIGALTPEAKPMLYTVKENAIGALTPEAIDDAMTYVARGDKEAFRQLLLSERLFLLKPGVRVYREGCGNRKCTAIKIRPVGQTFTLYTDDASLGSN